MSKLILMSAQNQPVPSLLVVILNYRTPNLTIDCLHSLEEEVRSLPNTKVAVVDNDSGDRSFEQINHTVDTQNWRDWVSVTASGRNGGYAFGNNVAIRPALASDYPPDYVLLLNPDTKVRPGALRVLLDFMEQNPQVGIAGSRLEEPDGTPQCSAFRFPTFWSELDSSLRLGIVSQLLAKWIVAPEVSEVACTTDWVAGASMMVRRQVFLDVGLIDEEYFMYFEELDFCLQAQKAGWSCWYVPESKVIHFVGQSSGVTNTKVAPKRRPKYWFESRQRFFLKNYGFAYTLFADTLWMLGFMAWQVRRVMQNKPNIDPPFFLIDFFSNSLISSQFTKQISKSKIDNLQFNS